MSEIFVNFNQTVQKIKPMNAVNNGPIVARSEQTITNEQAYRELCIPFARCHDTAHYSSYGGRFSVDVHNIFTDFNADENDERSYEFDCTDKYIADTLSVGTQTYYRLGASIEPEIKKHFTKPPKDFAKWARVCEHIIAHYNRGWANGFHYGIEYWEIWNEPDLFETMPVEQRQTWGGSRQEFFDFFEIAAKHLKGKYPELKIGGPALAHNVMWADDFLDEMAKRNVPIDFFSWHCYNFDPYVIGNDAQMYRDLLDKHGYTDAESHCNEWNYVKGWAEEWVYSIRQMIGLKGAAFVAAVMQDCQNRSVDMLMYYDFRPIKMNGVFDYYDFHKLKAYFSFLIWKEAVRLGIQKQTVNNDKELFTTAAADDDGNGMVSVTYYQDNDEIVAPKNVKLNFEPAVTSGKLYVLDATKDLELVSEFSGDSFELSLTPNATVMVTVKY